jgi:hypothetical protein
VRCAGKCFARAATKGGSLSAETIERPAALSERGKEADKPAQGAKSLGIMPVSPDLELTALGTTLGRPHSCMHAD